MLTSLNDEELLFGVCFGWIRELANFKGLRYALKFLAITCLPGCDGLHLLAESP